MNGKIIEQVRGFNYLGGNISYSERKEVNSKISFKECVVLQLEL